MASMRRKQFKEEERPNNRINKKKCAERGPTKREMREELVRKKSGKMGGGRLVSQKNNKKDGKDLENNVNASNQPVKQDRNSSTMDKVTDIGESKNKIRDRLRVEKRKADRKKKVISVRGNDLNTKEKVMYSEENINAFLLEAKNNESADKALNMILFLFKTFKDRPEELLAKIKVLTTGKNVEDDEDIRILVLKHLFKYFDMKGDFKDCLFTLFGRDTLISRYAAEFLFSVAYDSAKYDYHFETLCTELASKLEKTAVLSCNEYVECLNQIDSYESVQAYVDAVSRKMDEENLVDQTVESVAAISKIKNEEAKDETSDPESEIIEKNNVEDESSISLVSLNDDNEIERIDRQLGEMFKKNTVSVADIKSVSNIIKCIELLIKHNYAVKADNIAKVLYFIQFDSTSKSVKFIIKDILSKVNDRERIFKIYQMCTLILPECHQLFNMFCNYCGSVFDLRLVMASAFKFGHEDFLVTKVGLERYSQVYESTLGEPFDEFLVVLIQNETQVEKLKNLQGLYFKPEIQEAISQSLKKFKSKKEIPASIQ